LGADDDVLEGRPQHRRHRRVLGHAHTADRRLAPLADDIGSAELPRQGDTIRVAPQQDDLLDAEAAGGDHSAQADRLDDTNELVAHATPGLAGLQMQARVMANYSLRACLQRSPDCAYRSEILFPTRRVLYVPRGAEWYTDSLE
jgi:hypothetical protein